MSTIDYRVPRDATFKSFFLNWIFIRHLLRAYPLHGIDEADVVAIDAVSANLIGPKMAQRITDAAWRLTLANGELVYLLIECQSTVDPSMPFRMLHSVATLYLALSRDPPREAGYSAAVVPRVKHVTIYTGERPWSALDEVGQAIAVGCAEDERDIPRMASGRSHLTQAPCSV